MLTAPARLAHVAAKAAQGAPIKIVALGSSSTAGTGASSPSATYPSQLQQALQKLLPHSPVVVINKGVGGERVEEMAARFERDVLDEHPDLLIWQIGTNSALRRDSDVGDFIETVLRGIDRAQAAGVDVMLISPQFSPRVQASPTRAIYIRHVAIAAELRQIPLIRLYEMMHYWLDSKQMTPAEMVNPDGLHLTDRSYACLGETAATMVSALSAAPKATIASSR